MRNMRIIIKEAAPVPVYKQIKEEIKNYLIENKVQEGTLLPDIKTIASIAGVSIKTVERALNELIKENICFRRPKKGTFVGKINYTMKKKICGIIKMWDNINMEEMICRNSLSQIGDFSYLLRIFNPCLIHEGRGSFIFNESIRGGAI